MTVRDIIDQTLQKVRRKIVACLVLCVLEHANIRFVVTHAMMVFLGAVFSVILWKINDLDAASPESYSIFIVPVVVVLSICVAWHHVRVQAIAGARHLYAFASVAHASRTIVICQCSPHLCPKLAPSV